MSSMTDSANTNAEEGVLQVSVISAHLAVADGIARTKERLEIDFVFDPLVTTLRVILEDMKGAIEEMGYVLPLQSLTSYLVRVVPSSENSHLNYDGLFPVKDFYNVRMFEIPWVKKELLRQHHAAKIHPEQHRGTRTVLVLSLEELAAAPDPVPTTTNGVAQPLEPEPNVAAPVTIVGDLTTANVNTLINNSMGMGSTTSFPLAPDDPVPSAALRAWQATATGTTGTTTDDAAVVPLLKLPTAIAGASANAVQTTGSRGPLLATTTIVAGAGAGPRLDDPSTRQEVAEYVRQRMSEEEEEKENTASGNHNGRWSPQQWDQTGGEDRTVHVSVEEKLRLRGEWLQRLRKETERLHHKTIQMQVDMREVQHFRTALVQNLKKEVEQLGRQEQARRNEVAHGGAARDRAQQEHTLRDGISRLQNQLAIEKKKEEILLAEIRQAGTSRGSSPRQPVESAIHTNGSRANHDAANSHRTPVETRPLDSSPNETPTHLAWDETTFNANTTTQDATPPTAKANSNNHNNNNNNNVVHLGTLQSMLAKERGSPAVEAPSSRNNAAAVTTTTTTPTTTGAELGENSFHEQLQAMTEEERRELYRFSERLSKHCKPATVTSSASAGNHAVAVPATGGEDAEGENLSEQERASLLQDVRQLRERMSSHTDAKRTKNAAATAVPLGLGAPPANALREAAWEGGGAEAAEKVSGNRKRAKKGTS